MDGPVDNLGITSIKYVVFPLYSNIFEPENRPRGADIVVLHRLSQEKLGNRTYGFESLFRSRKPARAQLSEAPPTAAPGGAPARYAG